MDGAKGEGEVGRLDTSLAEKGGGDDEREDGEEEDDGGMRLSQVVELARVVVIVELCGEGLGG